MLPDLPRPPLRSSSRFLPGGKFATHQFDHVPGFVPDHAVGEADDSQAREPQFLVPRQVPFEGHATPVKFESVEFHHKTLLSPEAINFETADHRVDDRLGQMGSAQAGNALAQGQANQTMWNGMSQGIGLLGAAQAAGKLNF